MKFTRQYDKMDCGPACVRMVASAHDFTALLNALLRESRGEYIARMDSDDIMMPGRLSAQVKADILTHLISEANPGYTDPVVGTSGNDLTFIITNNKTKHYRKRCVY